MCPAHVHLHQKEKRSFWSLLGRSIRSPGPESPDSEVSGLCAENVLSLWWGPEFPAPVTGVSAPGRSFRPPGPECLLSLAWPKRCSAPGGGRSIRPQETGVSAPRPEYPATSTGYSGVKRAATASFSGRGINTPPLSSSQLARPQLKKHHCCKLKKHKNH